MLAAMRWGWRRSLRRFFDGLRLAWDTGRCVCANAIHAGVREAAIDQDQHGTAAQADTRSADACGLNSRPRRKQHGDAVAKLRPSIRDSGGQQRAAPGGAQLEQPGETGRIRAGGAGGSDHPIVAGQFAFAIDLPQHPRGHRMQCEHGAGDPCQQVGPIVAPRDVRQFVQQDVIEFRGSQVRRAGLRAGPRRDAGSRSPPAWARRSRSSRRAGRRMRAGHHPGIEVGLLFPRGGPPAFFQTAQMQVTAGQPRALRAAKKANHTARNRSGQEPEGSTTRRRFVPDGRGGKGAGARVERRRLRRRHRLAVREAGLSPGSASRGVQAAERRTPGRPTRRPRGWPH